MARSSNKVSTDYSLISQYANLNEFLLTESKKNKYFKNYIYFYTTPNRPKVSITCKFDEKSTGYYGLHPRVTVSIIKAEILKNNNTSIFSTKVKLFDYINRNPNIWYVPDDDKHSILDGVFCAKCLLTMASFFYFDLDLSSIENNGEDFFRIINNYSELINELKTDVPSETVEPRYDFSFTSINPDEQKKEGKKRFHRLHGRLPEVILKELDNSGYSFRIADNHIVVLKSHKKGNFSSLYSEDNADYLLCTSNAFYSGVNLRLKKVEIDSNSNSNSQLSSLILTVERTTFGTICGFDGFFRGKVSRENKNNIIGHPYLADYQQKLYEVIRSEINTISNNMPFVFSSFSDQNIKPIPSKEESSSIEESMNSLNNYLDQSIYPHYINVSGNIITNDNYCIYARRGNSTTDAETLYCSVNGVSEVFDTQVDFYSQSFEEDSPTIIYPSNGTRIDFNGELSRESEAELGTSSFLSYWKYYGFSIMGYHDQTNKIIDACHFNIAAYNHVNSSFLDIRNFRENATEKFETDSLYGFKLKISGNYCEKIKSSVNTFSENFLIWKDVVLLFALIIASLANLIARNVNSWSELWGYVCLFFNKPCDYFCLLFKWFLSVEGINAIVVFIFVMSFINVFRNTFKIRKPVSTYSHCLRKSEPKFEKILPKLLKRGRLKTAHPIVLLMGSLYFLHEADRYKNKEKRKPRKG